MAVLTPPHPTAEKLTVNDALPENHRGQLLETLRQRGLRMTPQRETILDLFFNASEGDHLSVDEVYEQLVAQNAGVSLATTYRTLKLFVSMGVMRELDFSEDHKHYELIRNAEAPHHHIICMDCGKTAEFESPEIAALVERIAREKNLRVVDAQLKIFAHCNDLKDDEGIFIDHESLKK